MLCYFCLIDIRARIIFFENDVDKDFGFANQPPPFSILHPANLSSRSPRLHSVWNSRLNPSCKLYKIRYFDYLFLLKYFSKFCVVQRTRLTSISANIRSWIKKKGGWSHMPTSNMSTWSSTSRLHQQTWNSRRFAGISINQVSFKLLEEDLVLWVQEAWVNSTISSISSYFSFKNGIEVDSSKKTFKFPKNR